MIACGLLSKYSRLHESLLGTTFMSNNQSSSCQFRV